MFCFRHAHHDVFSHQLTQLKAASASEAGSVSIPFVVLNVMGQYLAQATYEISTLAASVGTLKAEVIAASTEHTGMLLC